MEKESPKTMKSLSTADKVKRVLAVYAERGQMALDLFSANAVDKALEKLAQRDRGFANLEALMLLFDHDTTLPPDVRKGTQDSIARVFGEQTMINAKILVSLKLEHADANVLLGQLNRGSRVIGSYRS